MNFFFSGVGATGKTTLIQQLCNKFTSAKVVPSSTRKTYARLGIQTEKDKLDQDPNTQVNLQKELLADYFENLVLTQRGAPDNQIWFIDRSPLDYVSYTLATCQYADTALLRDFLETSRKLFLRLEGVVFHLPFPGPVSQLAAEDGLRHNSYHKNYAWNVMLRSFYLRVQMDPQRGGSWVNPSMIFMDVKQSSVEDRVQFCSQIIQGDCHETVPENSH